MSMRRHLPQLFSLRRLRSAPRSAATLSPRLTCELLEERTTPDTGLARLLAPGADATGWVGGLYQQLLDRPADASGSAYWQEQHRAGVAPEQIVAGILASPEYVARQGGDDAWLPGLYGDLFQRLPDADGLAFWSAAQAQGAPRLTIAIDFLHSAEFRARAYGAPITPQATFQPLLTPNDPSYGSLWGLNGAYGIQASSAWDGTTGRADVSVAVIDTGVDYDHPDLYLNIWINQGEIPASRRVNLTDLDGDGVITFWDLNNPANQGLGKISDVNSDGRISATDLLAPLQDDGTGGWADGLDQDPLPTFDPLNSFIDDLVGWNFFDHNNRPMDDHSHGTHVAGTIAATGNNGVGVVGVTWKASVAPLRFIGNVGGAYEGSDEDAAKAIRYAADKGIRISNNSYGGDEPAPLFIDAVNYAATKGHLFVVAAGNSGANIDTTPTWPAAYHLPNMVVVASTTSSGSLSSFSNYSATLVDVGAPGSGILSTVPGGGYSTKSGTSMATPHVAGAAALLLARKPSLSLAELRQRLLTTTTPLASLSGKTVSGGLVNVASAIAQTDWQTVGSGVSQFVVGTTAAGTQQLFAIRPDNSLAVKVQAPDGSWGDWVALGHQAKKLAVTRNAAGLLDLAVIGMDNHLWVRAQTAPGAFAPWADLGGLCKQLAAATAADGRQQIFVIGFDDGLWTRRQNADGSFGAWTNLGGLCKALATTTNAAGLQDVYVIGFDNAVWKRAQTAPGTFGAWTSLAGSCKQLAVGTGADGRQQIFIIGSDDSLSVRRQNADGSFGAWTNLGGLCKQIALGRTASGLLDVVVIGFDNAPWGRHQTAAGVFAAWTKISSLSVSAVRLAQGTGPLTLFGQSGSNVLQRDATW